jgi:hypothetical protein
MPLPNPARQKTARDRLATVLAHPPSVYAIHYACQSFDEAPEAGSSLRTICIALRQFDTGQSTTFSIAKIAELARIAPSNIPLYLDYLERTMLGEFYAFVHGTRGAKYVHWHMRDDRFGFAALEHRLTVLKGRPEYIPDEHRIDLARIVPDIYGDDYVTGGARLQTLAERNGFAMSGFLPGSAEAEAVTAGRYRDVLASTLTKVRLIADIAERAHARTLTTDAGLIARHGGSLRLTLQKLSENPGYTIASAGAGAFIIMLKAYDWLFGAG